MLLNFEKDRVKKESIMLGLENEFYGMKRIEAIKVVAKTLGNDENSFTHSRIHGLDVYATEDIYGRTWKVVSDSSIKDENGVKQNLYDEDCELVTPIIGTADFDTVTAIITALKNSGAVTNSLYNGLHVHASHELLQLAEIKKCIQHMATRQDLLFRFCHMNENRIEWAVPTDIDFAKSCKKAKDFDELKKMYYGDTREHENHYDFARYKNLNLHSYFEGKGIEFRLFNATLEIESIMAILDLVQGFVYDAICSYKMSQYVHTDRTVYSNPDRMEQLLKTYIKRMSLKKSTEKYLLTNCLR